MTVGELLEDLRDELARRELLDVDDPVELSLVWRGAASWQIDVRLEVGGE